MKWVIIIEIWYKGRPLDLVTTVLALPLAAVIPGLLLLVYFNAQQGYHLSAEIVWNSVLLGAAASILAVALELPVDGLVEHLRDPYHHAFARAFLGTAAPEELSKFIIVYWIALRHEDYGRPVDALVLAVAVALGFATFENLLYLVHSDDWTRTAAARAMTAVPSHVVNAMLMGYFLGRTFLAPSKAPLFNVLALAVPVVNHGLYDLPLFTIDALEFTDSGRAAELSLILAFAAVIAAGSVLALGCWYDLLRRDALDAAAHPPPFVIERLPTALRRWEAGFWILIGGLLTAYSLWSGFIGFFETSRGSASWLVLYPRYFVLASSILPCIFGCAMLAHGVTQLREAATART